MVFIRPALLATLGFCLILAGAAFAQTPAIDIIPASTSTEGGQALADVLETHPPLKLSPDKSEIVTLDEDIGTVVLGNPAHLNILADSARRLIAVPKAPGASYFTVLNKAGEVIMQRHVLVAPPKEKYVRVRKTCYGDAAASGCQAMQTYYCPDTCHEVASASGEEKTSGASADTDKMKESADEMAGEEDPAAESEEDPQVQE